MAMAPRDPPPKGSGSPTNDPAALLERMKHEAPHTYGAALVQAYRKIRTRGEDPYPVRARLEDHVRTLATSGRLRSKDQSGSQPTVLERYANAVLDLQSAVGSAAAPKPLGQTLAAHPLPPEQKKVIRAAELKLERMEQVMLEQAAAIKEGARPATPATAPRTRGRGGSGFER